jgi:hypothetical protein
MHVEFELRLPLDFLYQLYTASSASLMLVLTFRSAVYRLSFQRT